MKPYVTLYTKTPPIMDNGHPAHPLEDPLNWPEQKSFGMLFEKLSRLNRRLINWRMTRTDARHAHRGRRVGTFEH